MNYDAAFEKLTSPAEEGGYVDNRADPGGKTRWGVTEAVARVHGYTGDMDKLPLSVAKVIYLNDYWRPAGCDALPDFIRYPVFSLAVNAGVHTALRTLQRALGLLNLDGVLGPLTLQAVSTANPERLLARMTAARLLYYTSLSSWPAFGRGWTARECNNVLNN